MDPLTRRLGRTARDAAGALFRASNHPLGGGAGIGDVRGRHAAQPPSAGNISTEWSDLAMGPPGGTTRCQLSERPSRLTTGPWGPTDYGSSTLKVSQSAGCPDSKPRLNHSRRCSEVPWVNESGSTLPPACF